MSATLGAAMFRGTPPRPRNRESLRNTTGVTGSGDIDTSAPGYLTIRLDPPPPNALPRQSPSSAHHHPNPIPRHPAHPALLNQKPRLTPHTDYLTMSGALEIGF